MSSEGDAPAAAPSLGQRVAGLEAQARRGDAKAARDFAVVLARLDAFEERPLEAIQRELEGRRAERVPARAPSGVAR